MGPLLILLLASAPAGWPQEPVFRADSALVYLDVQVVDGQRPIANLTQDDFLIFEDGRPREIAHFGREREPLSLVLLLDLSGSMSRYLRPMVARAREALKNLREGDRVAIMPFSRRSMTFTSLTSDFPQVERELASAVNISTLGSGTIINSAVIDAARYLRQEAGVTQGRRAILIVTDNQGLNYQIPDEQVIRELHESSTVLNAIVTGKGRRPGPAPPGANPDFTQPDVWKLAEETGGEAVKEDKTDVWFPQMLERIRARYNLQYRPEPAAPGTFRHVKVELTPAARKKHPRAEVRSRSGYWTM